MATKKPTKEDASTEVAKVENTAVATAEDPYAEFGNDGLDDVKVTDITIPFLELVQANSNYITEQTLDVRPGQLVNSVTKEIMTLPIIAQPVHYEEVWVNWSPRGSDGPPILGRYDPNSQVVLDVIAKNNGSVIPPEGADKKRIPFAGPDGGELIQTFYWYVNILDKAGKEIENMMIIPFSSTKIAVQKAWLSSLVQVKGTNPLYCHRSAIETVSARNTKGNFFNFKISPFAETYRESRLMPHDDQELFLLREGKRLRAMITKAEILPDDSNIGHDAGADTDGTSTNDDDIPFG